MDETWIPVLNGRYEVSNAGFVRNAKTGRLRKPHPDRDGYLRMSVYYPPDTTGSEAVHRLVCEAFHGPAPEGKPWALHRNGNPADNRPENLYWGSPSENVRDAFRHGTARMSNRTGCDKGHTYEAGTYYVSKTGKRICKECVGSRRVPPPPEDPRHGKKSTYDNLGCRCDECREGKRKWSRQHREKQKLTPESNA